MYRAQLLSPSHPPLAYTDAIVKRFEHPIGLSDWFFIAGVTDGKWPLRHV